LGKDITAEEWQQFVDRDVTPRFRDGLTVFDAHGQCHLTILAKPLAVGIKHRQPVAKARRDVAVDKLLPLMVRWCGSRARR
jgi:hypothetical protein